jgi:hypothetical protein
MDLENIPSVPCGSSGLTEMLGETWDHELSDSIDYIYGDL